VDCHCGAEARRDVFRPEDVVMDAYLHLMYLNQVSYLDQRKACLEVHVSANIYNISLISHQSKAGLQTYIHLTH
jgi:hypothetical protein